MRGYHQQQTYVSHNARCKVYPDGSKEILVCDRAIWHPDWERSDKHRNDPKTPILTPDLPENDSEELKTDSDRARRRARAAVRDIALSTPFTQFVTFTIDQTKLDRYDPAAVVKKLNTWLDNRVRRKGLCYVLVPELHKDGAIHFHGLLNDALPRVDSGHVDEVGHCVYNLPDWVYGYTTAIDLYGERAQAVSYVCKYLSKTEDKIGGRWYYSGGKLERPELQYFDAEFCMGEDGGFLFTVPEAALGFKLYRIPAGE